LEYRLQAEFSSLKLLPPKGGTPTFLPIFGTFCTASLATIIAENILFKANPNSLVSNAEKIHDLN
jgi:hypothetical protein